MLHFYFLLFRYHYCSNCLTMIVDSETSLMCVIWRSFFLSCCCLGSLDWWALILLHVFAYCLDIIGPQIETIGYILLFFYTYTECFHIFHKIIFGWRHLKTYLKAIKVIKSCFWWASWNFYFEAILLNFELLFLLCFWKPIQIQLK